MLPKAEAVRTIASLARRFPNAAILPLVESAKGFAALSALAGAPSVARLVFGTVDFQLDLGIVGQGEELLFFRSQFVLQSRLAGIAAPVDGVCVMLDDPDTLRSESAHARRVGFGGKLCIHPRQVGIVAKAFCASEAELARSRAILNAAEASNGGTVSLDGQMIDRPVVESARCLLARHA
jgi:citrate lyase subunit beta/citryl-CoA lyase